jgi:hypothetical protein
MMNTARRVGLAPLCINSPSFPHRREQCQDRGKIGS